MSNKKNLKKTRRTSFKTREEIVASLEDLNRKANLYGGVLGISNWVASWAVGRPDAPRSLHMLLTSPCGTLRIVRRPFGRDAMKWGVETLEYRSHTGYVILEVFPELEDACEGLQGCFAKAIAYNEKIIAETPGEV